MRLETLEKEKLKQLILSENNNFNIDFGVSKNIFLKILNRFQQIIKENIISISKKEKYILFNIYSKTEEMIQRFRISGKKLSYRFIFPYEYSIKY